MNEENNGIGVEAFEMIDGLSKRINQLTLEIVAKDIIIRKLQDQLQGEAGQSSTDSDQSKAK